MQRCSARRCRTTAPGATSRLSHGGVAKRPGTRVRVGGALLEVVRPAPPCRVMDDAVGPGAARAMHDRGGSIFRVLESGDIAVGDVWQELPPDPA